MTLNLYTLSSLQEIIMAKLSPVVVIVTCAFLIRVTIIGSDFLFYHSVSHIAFGFFASEVVAYLLYPLLGWISDVYFARYKVLQLAFLILIAGSAVFILVTSAGLFGNFSELGQLKWLTITAGLGTMILCRAGLGLFEANAIQFGMDQLLEASSDQLSSFIHWYYWSFSLGRLAIYYMWCSVAIYYSECQIHFNMSNPTKSYNKYNYEIYYTCLFGIGVIQGVAAIVGLLLLVCNKKNLNIEVPSHNPLKLVYQVLKYSWKHKVPEHRSAFTYWEEDIPPRIDLGKSKYGGPFTTEEVEDTKAFLRIILLLTTLVGFHLSSHGNQLSKRLMQNECPSFWVLVLVSKPSHFSLLTIVIGIPLYQLARHQMLLQPEVRAKHAQENRSSGLLCCLEKGDNRTSIARFRVKIFYCFITTAWTYRYTKHELLVATICLSRITNHLTGNGFPCI